LTTGGAANGTCIDGGKGGNGNQSGDSGANGGGSGGTAGYAIIIYNDGTGTTITNVGGSINGTIQYNTAPS
jgi:hypothetical protein